MQAQTSRLYSWALQKAESTKAPLWIALLFALEIVLFVPLDAILMFFCLQNKNRIPLYVAIATIASTVSAVAGYLIGHFLWDLVGSYVVPHFVSASTFSRISLHFQTYEHWAVFIGALVPFPLKALSLSAGVFHLGVWPFLSYFMGARLMRFCLIGSAMFLWGERVKQLVDRHFHRIVMVVGAKIAVAFVFFWTLAR